MKKIKILVFMISWVATAWVLYRFLPVPIPGTRGGWESIAENGIPFCKSMSGLWSWAVNLVGLCRPGICYDPGQSGIPALEWIAAGGLAAIPLVMREARAAKRRRRAVNTIKSIRRF